MRLARLLRLVGWHLRFTYLHVASLAFFLVYVHLYDSTVVASLFEDTAFPEPYCALALIFEGASHVLEPQVAAFHVALAVALLFSYEAESGLWYIEHLAGYSRPCVLLSKLAASFALTSTPLVASKVLYLAIWDPQLLLRYPIEAALKVLELYLRCAVYYCYVLSFTYPVAILLRRTSYVVGGLALYIFAFEGPFATEAPLRLFGVYATLMFSQLGLNLRDLLEVLGLRAYVSAAMLGVAVAAYMRGEYR